MSRIQLLLNFALIPTFDLSRIVGWIKSALADALKWAALRMLLIGLVGTLVPLAIYQGWLLISEQLLTWANANMMGESWSGTTVQLTGLGAWIGIRLKVVECFQVLTTFLVMRFTLGFFRK